MGECGEIEIELFNKKPATQKLLVNVSEIEEINPISCVFHICVKNDQLNLRFM
jgi:hypothetical protein